MPTYEYLCPQGHEFEKFQKITDRARVKCPSCGQVASRRISGGAGLLFKGSGFYITDYGKDGKGPRKGGDDAGPKADAASSGTADAKPDPAKTDTKPKPAKKAEE